MYKFVYTTQDIYRRLNPHQENVLLWWEMAVIIIYEWPTFRTQAQECLLDIFCVEKQEKKSF